MHVAFGLEIETGSEALQKQDAVLPEANRSLGKEKWLQDSPLNWTKIKFGTESCFFMLEAISI